MRLDCQHADNNIATRDVMRITDETETNSLIDLITYENI
jgi:hypothetical protein